MLMIVLDVKALNSLIFIYECTNILSIFNTLDALTKHDRLCLSEYRNEDYFDWVVHCLVQLEKQ